MMARMRISDTRALVFPVIVVALATLVMACGSSRRGMGPPPDGGADAVADGPPSEGAAADAPADADAPAGADAHAGGDARADADTSGDSGADADDDAGSIAFSCVNAPVANVCGCGCCGGQPMSTTCYYPALGQLAGGIPDPRPSDCSAVGCSAGVRHICCVDPGPPPPPGDAGSGASYCAYDPATDLPRIIVERRDGQSCLSVRLAGRDVPPPASGAAPIPGWVMEGATS